jgi:hypothetical protein
MVSAPFFVIIEQLHHLCHCPVLPDRLYPSVEKLQKALDQWLQHYNYERPHRGYRNMGRRPFETIEAGKVIKEQLTTKEAA